MRLVSVDVEKYRSIKTAKKISISDLTVIVGPNNEGKSNFLKALSSVFSVLEMWCDAGDEFDGFQPYRDKMTLHNYTNMNPDSSEYNRFRDFPISLQGKQQGARSAVTLEFELDQSERRKIRQLTGISLNETLRLTLTFGRSDVKLDFRKQGPYKKNLEDASVDIVRFILDNFALEYIPAVRTAEAATEVASRLIQRELQKLERRPEYTKAMKELDGLQRPVLQELAKNISASVREFLPSVVGIDLRIRQSVRNRALRQLTDIVVDDGVATNLKHKGDGVQSLVALALMRHTSSTRSGKKHSLVAIEEPESHLHPRAIHELRKVVDDLRSTNQIILTTHSPIFVNRSSIENNIVVRKNQVKSATHIGEIREALGVKISDNLQSADLILLVEGPSDKKVLNSYLSCASTLVANALSDGRLAIDTIGGGGNLSYKIGLHLRSLCKVHCFLDNDASGQSAFK